MTGYLHNPTVQPRRLGRAHMSKHAERRAKDRTIPASIVDALLDFGDHRKAGDGAEAYYFTKRSWRRFAAYIGRQAAHFERYRSTYVVLASNGEVITVAWRH